MLISNLAHMLTSYVYFPVRYLTHFIYRRSTGHNAERNRQAEKGLQ